MKNIWRWTPSTYRTPSWTPGTRTVTRSSPMTSSRTSLRRRSRRRQSCRRCSAPTGTHQIFFIVTTNIFYPNIKYFQPGHLARVLGQFPAEDEEPPAPRCPAPPPRCPPSRRIVLRPAEHQGPRKQHHHSSTPPAHPKHSRSLWTTSPCLQVTTTNKQGQNCAPKLCHRYLHHSVVTNSCTLR